MHFLKILLLVLLFFVDASYAADKESLQLSSDFKRASLASYAEQYVDVTGRLTFEQAREVSFRKLKEFRSSGFSSQAIWYRFNLSRTSDSPTRWLLSLGSPFLDDVRVWVVSSGKSPILYQLGDHTPYVQRPLPTRTFSVPLDLSETVTIYVRIQSTSVLNFSAEIWQPETMIGYETQTGFYQGAYFGILGIIIVLNFLLGTWLRNYEMVAYAGYVSCIFMIFLGLHGYAAIVFTTAPSWFMDGLMGGAATLCLVTGIAMWIQLLNLKIHCPRVYSLYLAIIILALCMLPFVASSYYRVTGPLVLKASAAFVIGNSILIIVLWYRQKAFEVMLYFLAFSANWVGVLIHIAYLLGWLPHNTITSNSFQIASLVHVLLMNGGIAMHLRQMQHKTAIAEQNAAIATRRAEDQKLFVAMLSHEFRNPLAAIDRAAQMIRLKMPTISTTEINRLDNIRINASKLYKLIDNFLIMEALDHQTLQLTCKRHAIRPLLEEILQSLDGKDVERISITVKPSDAAYYLDATLMGLAISNLVNNALQYSPQQSPINISAHINENKLTIQIVDHGPGMEKDEIAMLGTPYFRSTSSIAKKGCGLGYHIAKRITEAHGGSLQAHSIAGEGLQVNIQLPESRDLY